MKKEYFYYYKTTKLFEKKKMSLSDSITSLRTMLDTCENEIKSLESGRKASSARARKSLQNIKTASHSLRKDITTHTKALPTKSRSKKVVEVEPAEVVEPVVEPTEPKKRVSRSKKTMPQE